LTKFDKPQVKHVTYGASTHVVVVEEPVVAAAPVEMECLDVESMPVNATC
jgi:hypothetical protein